MRYKTFRLGGHGYSGISLSGGNIGGPLLLTNNPTEIMHAATKSYLDSKLNNINASSFTSGIFSAERLPLFTGDATKQEGSTVVTLNNTGVLPDSYGKVTINAKGIITAGYLLEESDLPELSWSKVSINKPTNISGYGILDAISTTGGVMTGILKCNVIPTSPNHVVTKQYVDGLTENDGNGINTGDYVIKHDSVTPTGFLRCNGGEVSKTTYAALYAVIGDAFSIDMQLGNGQPWRQQYQINTTQSTDITGWTTGTSLPGTLRDSQAIVTKNRVYLLGGDNGSITVSTVYTAPINSDGTLGAWTAGTSLPGALNYSQAIVTKNRVYLLGGYNGSYLSTVYTAPINSDGTLGAWTTGTSLPGALGSSQAIVTRSRVYLLGGLHEGRKDKIVRTAPINADGTLGAWTTGTSLPGDLTDSQAIVTKNRVYLLGGENGAATSIVYTAPINADGTLGTWTTGTSLPGDLSNSQAIVTKNRVYLLGGKRDTATVSTVYTAPINADGTLGTWTTGTSLPVALTRSQAIVTKNRVYLLGGRNITTTVSTVYTAPILEGLNDYSPYYDGTFAPTDPNNFNLPDLTSEDLFNTYTYIKH